MTSQASGSHARNARAVAASVALLTFVLVVPGSSTGMSLSHLTATAVDAYVLSDGTVLTADVAAAHVVVPTGAVVYAARDIVVNAETLQVDGTFIALAPDLPGADAYDIVLRAQTVRITGTVRTSDGMAGQLVEDNARAVAGAGGRGGDLRVEYLTLFLDPGAVLETGRGGWGGDALVVTNAASPRSLYTQGGAGGAGGDLQLVGSAASLLGRLHLGNGGKGGLAETKVLAGTPPQFGSYAEGFGGAGGDPGQPALPAGYDLLSLYAAGLLTGSRGGDGGDASAEGPQDPDGSSDAGVLAPGGCGANGVWPDGNGNAGCTGASFGQNGGAGGCATGLIICLLGGTGGGVSLTAGIGGTGGSGAHGEDGLLVSNPFGGNGARGGNGGSATARGGNGGFGTLQGGKGGSATANGGRGGAGGAAGNGGRTVLVTAHIGIPHGCFLNPVCYLGIGPEIVCGHKGAPGLGGSGGGRTATGGSPGGSTTGLNGGVGATGGASGATGTTGGSGVDASCVHPGAAHNHNANVF